MTQLVYRPEVSCLLLKWWCLINVISFHIETSFFPLDVARDKRKLMDIFEPFQQVSMWGDNFKVDGGLNSITSPMLLVNTSMENKVIIEHEFLSLFWG